MSVGCASSGVANQGHLLRLTKPGARRPPGCRQCIRCRVVEGHTKAKPAERKGVAGGYDWTAAAVVALPTVRMKQLHGRRSDASHQFPFSAIEALDTFLPALHPVADHSNDLGRIVTQEEVRLAPSLVRNEEMALHINSCLLVVIASLLA
ncbi:uncharacterized protein LOC142563469 [Dermacentor variabilis]|uniref:uncharacterized protein LOC142563469 n=1 Tax=Dermacentor variabilis TaxID=34621 RepID=UPI003F5C7583